MANERRRRTDLSGPEPVTNHDFIVQIYSATNAIDAKLNDVCEKQDIYQKRLRDVEIWQQKANGALMLAVKSIAIITALVALFGLAIKIVNALGG